ncbi:MAG: hypothetical protein FWF77_09650 [Defluviitaleaceae bacterium]|nr:hypothetical protein [Defluviitaleaceae bacterium]
MKDVFDKAKSTVKQTVDTASEKVKRGEVKSMIMQTADNVNAQVSSGGVKVLLTKRNIIIAVVAVVIVVGGLLLFFGNRSGNPASLATGHLRILPDLDVRLGMTVSEIPEIWISTMPFGDGYIHVQGLSNAMDFTFEGVDFGAHIRFNEEVTSIIVAENDMATMPAVALIEMTGGRFQNLTSEHRQNIADRFVAIYGNPTGIRIGGMAVAWESGGYYLTLFTSGSQITITYQNFRPFDYVPN